MTAVNELEGQELREAIAIAKGWERKSSSGSDYWRTPEGREIHPGYMPKWDESYAAAFGLIKDLLYTIHHYPNNKELTHWVELYSIPDVEFGASTLPLAICRAWLVMKQAQTAEVAK